MGTRGDASRHLRTLARDVRRARNLIGWSQEDLAQAARVGQATISRIERGTCTRLPYLTVVRVRDAIARAFDALGDEARGHGIPSLPIGVAADASDVTIPPLKGGLAELARAYGALGEAERLSLVAVVRALEEALHS
jgi:transcriptional regulator with XRE-family HTH domain